MSSRARPDHIDRYEIVSLLGTGSFAAVYLARDPALDTDVALKVLGDHHSAVPDLRARFVNEARTLRRLASDRIVSIFDIGEWNGQPFVVMEALAGGTLDERLTGTPASADSVVRLVAELAACMSAAHGGGVVHRDIKPSNLLIRQVSADNTSASHDDDVQDDALIRDGERLVLADFGLARTLGLSGLTVAGGTDGFMAPEQRVMSSTVDERADLYAATAVVAISLKGSLDPDVIGDLFASDDPVDQALARGLASDPHDRPADAASWADELTSALGATPERRADTTTSASAGRDDDQERVRTRSPVFVGVAVAACFVLVALAVVLSQRGGDPDPVAGATTAEVSADISADDDAAPAVEIAAFAGEWSTSGATIVNERNEPVAIRGVNWYGFETGAAVVEGLWARNWKELVDLVAELGFNTIRLPYSSAMLEPGTMPEGIDGTLNPDLLGLTSLEVMDAVIDHARSRGLAIVLDRHTLAPSDQADLWYDADFPAERFISDWELLAERYVDRPNVVGADLFDAPHGAACWGCGDESVDWKLAAQEAGNAIHRIAPEWLILVAGVERREGGRCSDPGESTCTWWGADLSGALDAPVELDQAAKVVYSPTDFGSSTFEQAWFDDEDFPANMPGLWDRWWGELETQDAAPVVMGAFGSNLETDTDQAWMSALLDHLAERDADFVFWALNPTSETTGGLLDVDWATVDERKMDLLRPYLNGPFE